MNREWVEIGGVVTVLVYYWTLAGTPAVYTKITYIALFYKMRATASHDLNGTRRYYYIQVRSLHEESYIHALQS